MKPTDFLSETIRKAYLRVFGNDREFAADKGHVFIEGYKAGAEDQVNAMEVVGFRWRLKGNGGNWTYVCPGHPTIKWVRDNCEVEDVLVPKPSSSGKAGRFVPPQGARDEVFEEGMKWLNSL